MLWLKYRQCTTPSGKLSFVRIEYRAKVAEHEPAGGICEKFASGRSCYARRNRTIDVGRFEVVVCEIATNLKICFGNCPPVYRNLHNTAQVVRVDFRELDK